MAYDTKGTVNKVILIGRLGQDPEVRYTQFGTAVVTLSVATNMTSPQNGEKTDYTEWHRVIVWGKAAEMIGQYAIKGVRVYVDGRIGTRSWEDKDGNKRYMTEITANQIQILSDRNAGQECENARQEAPAQEEMDFQDDADSLPF